MIVLLNGPLGIGKSTLAQALVESLEQSVMLDGDKLIAMNPAPANETSSLHGIVALLVEHHRRFGYRHFVFDHIWRSPTEIADLRHRLGGEEEDFRCFLLTLSEEEHLRRIERRASVRALDERQFELCTHAEERKVLAAFRGNEVGERFAVDAAPHELVKGMLCRLNLPVK